VGSENMLKRRLAELNRMYKQILHCETNQKEYNIALANLMKQMEIEFNIPILGIKSLSKRIERLSLFIEKYQ
jgi:hypothetical protein